MMSTKPRAARAVRGSLVIAVACAAVIACALLFGTDSSSAANVPSAKKVQLRSGRPAKGAEFGVVAGIVPVAVAAFVFVMRSRSNIASLAKTVVNGDEAPLKPAKAPRIDAFDSIRFFLIFYIACGHFISFAAPSRFAFRAMTQINVVVGAFFVLSGYVAAYVGCEIGEKKAKDRVTATPVPTFIVQKIFGYWPLHFLVLLLFSPMFIYADYIYNGPLITAWHGLLSVTMTAAWFPMHAEIWNAPTWFLGALTFANILMPYFIPILARQGKKELRRTAFWLTVLSLLPKLGYCYDLASWGMLEGAIPGKAFPNLAMFNSMRFMPVFATIEVMLGVVACRLVMLDGTDGEEAPKTGMADTVLPLVTMIGLILLRATGLIALSDMIVRPLIFMPLFCLFLMGLHRASIKKEVTDPLAKLLAWYPLIWLGGLSFPIFVVHGPIGQLFYKKAIASIVFGGPLHILCGPWFFWVYLLVVGFTAYLLNTYFMSSKVVAGWNKQLQTYVLKWL